MPFISSIASRIFGLAAGLVLLMILLVGFLLWQVMALNGEMRRIAGYFTPLDNALEELDDTGLQLRVAFERLVGALASQDERAEVIPEAQKNYDAFLRLTREQLQTARGMLANPPAHAEHVQELTRLRAVVDEMAAGSGIIAQRQQQVLDLLRTGEVARGDEILEVLDDVQSLVQSQRTETQRLIENLLASLTNEAARRHRDIAWTTIVATITSVLLGLAVAALTTRRLVEPVRSLMRGLATVESGDLSVELPVRSADEIGRLTRSFNFFVNELRRKEELRQTFGKYIDPRVLERVLDTPDAADAAGGRQEMTVSFADLVGFTEIGEQLTPAGVVNLLNRHFTMQAEAIQGCRGVVDKFMGDAVMAFWGEPFIGDENRAVLACRAALGQSQAIAELQRLLPEVTGLRKNLPRVDVRIGISTGEVVVGNIGSENTRAYTVIGDSVNLAARLEAANRFYGTSILICGTTRREAGDAIVAREIDTIVVKGKAEPATVYALLGLAGDATPDTLALCEHSTEAHAAYRERRWDDAAAHFRAILELSPGDRTAGAFLDRIAHFRAHPPAAGWAGAWELASK